MKFKLLSVLFGVAFAGSAVAGSCNVTTKACSPASPFDVDNVTFVQDSTTSTPDDFQNPFDCRVANFCFGQQVAISGQLLSLIQGMARYAEEYDDWAEANEWYQDYLYTKDLNASRTDNIAWAILSQDTHIRIQLEGDTRSHSYRPGRIISGSDWNNNGKIDTIEVMAGFRHGDAYIEMN